MGAWWASSQATWPVGWELVYREMGNGDRQGETESKRARWSQKSIDESSGRRNGLWWCNGNVCFQRSWIEGPLLICSQWHVVVPSASSAFQNDIRSKKTLLCRTAPSLLFGNTLIHPYIYILSHPLNEIMSYAPSSSGSSLEAKVVILGSQG